MCASGLQERFSCLLSELCLHCAVRCTRCACRIHVEPVSEMLFTEEAIFTGCCSGQIKCWLRPGLLSSEDPS